MATSKNMKTLIKSLAITLLVGATGLLFVGCASDHTGHHHAEVLAKPYPLKSCVVTDEAFHGDPYTFVHEGQEVKLCCKDCLDDFKKEPEKYMKKIHDAQAAEAK
jgi:hypothetical protein